jgi:hypothetical protein
MVEIFLPITAAKGVTQERTASPSTSTVQAPHCAMPHPNLVPVRFSCSLKTQSKGVSGLISNVSLTPFTVTEIMLTLPLWFGISNLEFPTYFGDNFFQLSLMPFTNS